MTWSRLTASMPSVERAEIRMVLEPGRYTQVRLILGEAGQVRISDANPELLEEDDMDDGDDMDGGDDMDEDAAS